MKCFLAIYAAKLKTRFELNPNQKSLLEKSFKVQFFPNKTTLKELVTQTGLSEKYVSLWFGHRRFKTRKGTCEGTLLIPGALLSHIHVIDHI